MKQQSYLKQISVFIILLGNLFLFTPVSIYAQVDDGSLFKFNRTLSYISSFYVDTVNQNELVESAIVEMLKQLDPHSIYISKEEVAAMNQPLQGNFEGVGIQFNILEDTILIVKTIPGGPSERQGIRAGDRIIAIEGENVAGVGIKNSEVRTYLLGEKGSKVTVSILRRGTPELINFTITRDKIPIYSLDASYMIEENIGYIKLNRFSATTMDEFHDALADLQKQGMEHLILDLQDNGGGYLNVAIQLADEFLEKNKLIVYTEGESSPRKEHVASSRGDFEEGRLVVLINEGSASASEIVSGAIQDWDRGIIVGRRSFGKGLVQRPFNLPDGSMIRLTTARYYTPTGRLIQKPYDEGVDEYRKEVINRYENGELLVVDSIHLPDSLRFYTKINQRLVFGGGGIMPDFFVPLDTASSTDYYKDLLQKGIINSFVLHYVDDNRRLLEKLYSDFEEFDEKFDVSNAMLNDLANYAESEGVDKNLEELEASTDVLKLSIKAYIVSDLWEVTNFYQLINQDNPAFIRAVEIIKDESLYENKLLSQN